MDELNKKKLEVIESILLEPECGISKMVAKEILTALDSLEPEQLEVEIYKINPKLQYFGVEIDYPDEFETIQKAIDFCKKHNLKVQECLK